MRSVAEASTMCPYCRHVVAVEGPDFYRYMATHKPENGVTVPFKDRKGGLCWGSAKHVVRRRP